MTDTTIPTAENRPAADPTRADAGRVLIFDTTLRDGEQSPGATMSHEEKLEIAAALDEMGVDIIEAGFPIASEGDFAAVSEIARNSRNSVICGLSRANFKDIDRCWEAIRHARAPRIHTFIGTSPSHREITKLNQDEMVQRIHETVTHARNLCDNVQWSAMDAIRTERDYLCRVVETAIKAGATTINIPDTVGYTLPTESAEIIEMLLEKVPGADEIVFATHCHNDLGMATANSLAAVAAGARQIECTINGLGERAGNTALEEVVMALRVRKDLMPYQTGIDTTKIMGLSRRVSQVSGFPVQFNKAIVGKNAFLHESGIHQDGVLKNVETFEIMRPADIGITETNIAMGKHSGRAALRSKLKELGFELGDNQLNDVFVRFKALADRKKEIFDEDLVALMADAAGTEAQHLQLVSLKVTAGTQAPECQMVLRVGEEEKTATTTGDGPIDACFNAVKEMTGHQAKLQVYQVNAITGGTDAQATVNVRMEEEGRIAQGTGSDTDTIVASVKAYLGALNRLYMRRSKSAPGEDSKQVSYKSAS